MPQTAVVLQDAFCEGAVAGHVGLAGVLAVARSRGIVPTCHAARLRRGFHRGLVGDDTKQVRARDEVGGEVVEEGVGGGRSERGRGAVAAPSQRTARHKQKRQYEQSAK